MSGVRKRKVIKSVIRQHIVELVCIQQTRIQDIVGLVCNLRVCRSLEWCCINVYLVFWGSLELLGS